MKNHGDNLIISKIKYVHNALTEKIEYVLEDECSGANKANVATSYGALVNGEAGFDGYAKAVKVILDKLQVPCVLVQGVCETEEDLFEVYMWNYVQIDNKWYAIDSSLDNRLGENSLKYFLVGEEMISKDHIALGKITSADFTFAYPVLEINSLSDLVNSKSENNQDSTNKENNVADTAKLGNISYVSKVKYGYDWREFNKLSLHANSDVSMSNWKTADESAGISNDLKDRMAIIVRSLSSSEASILNTKVRQTFQDDNILQGAFYDINLMVGDKKVSRTDKSINISADFPNRI